MAASTIRIAVLSWLFDWTSPTELRVEYSKLQNGGHPDLEFQKLTVNFSTNWPIVTKKQLEFEKSEQSKYLTNELLM